MEPRSRHRQVFGLVVPIVLVALLTGCSAGADQAAEEAPAPQEAQGPGATASDGREAQPSPPGASAADGATFTGGAGPPLLTTAALGRHVVRTAEIVLEVDDPAAAAEGVVAAAEGAGGFVAETDLRRERDDAVSGSMTLRVPADALDATMHALDALAEAVPVRRIEETDVTAETIDLEARRRNLVAYEDELRELLGEVRTGGGGAEELLRIFERIREVRGELDRIEAQLEVLADRVAMSTIAVRLQPGNGGLLVGTGWHPGERIQEAVATTLRALAVIADGAIWVLLTALPVAAAVASPALVTVVLYRRRRTVVATDGTGAPPARPG